MITHHHSYHELLSQALLINNTRIRIVDLLANSFPNYHSQGILASWLLTHGVLRFPWHPETLLAILVRALTVYSAPKMQLYFVFLFLLGNSTMVVVWFVLQQVISTKYFRKPQRNLIATILTAMILTNILTALAGGLERTWEKEPVESITGRGFRMLFVQNLEFLIDYAQLLLAIDAYNISKGRPEEPPWRWAINNGLFFYWIIRISAFSLLFFANTWLNILGGVALTITLANLTFNAFLFITSCRAFYQSACLLSSDTFFRVLELKATSKVLLIHCAFRLVSEFLQFFWNFQIGTPLGSLLFCYYLYFHEQSNYQFLQTEAEKVQACWNRGVAKTKAIEFEMIRLKDQEEYGIHYVLKNGQKVLHGKKKEEKPMELDVIKLNV